MSTVTVTDHSEQRQPDSRGKPEQGWLEVPCWCCQHRTARRGRSLFMPGEWSASEQDRSAYHTVIRTLGYLPPDQLFDTLRTLCLNETLLLQPQRAALIDQAARRGIAEFPDFLAAMDVEAFVAAHTQFKLTRGVHWVYTTACKSVPDLADQIVAYEGREKVQRALAAGPVILAAFHFGPSEFLVGGVASRVAPVTVVVSDQERRPTRANRWVMRSAASADIESVQNGSIGVLLRCLRALRAGRAVMIFPELSFSTGPEPRLALSFGGRTINVPIGIGVLAAKSGATVLPCHVESPAPGRYRYVFGDPIGPGPGLLAELFGYCEALIKSGLAPEWEFWPHVDRLLHVPPDWPDHLVMDSLPAQYVKSGGR
ncbi:MAG: hypothetical protein HOV87_09040 [Catenulispora sp.]|nr:hypothetical protein [Catenulispora sp.]